MFDIVLKNGNIVDGTGKEAYIADIGIIGDKIAQIGKIEESQGVKIIDASGKYITPGFIDTHSHADSALFLFPDCESYLRQGITTFIGGNCGDSNAPINNVWVRKYWEYDMWQDMDPFIYYPDIEQPVDRVKKIVFEKTGQEINWRTFGEYLNVISQKGTGANMVALLGHSQLRADVMGKDSNRKPGKEEMVKMKGHITEAMENGAWGLSVGRDYPPSAYAEMEEMEELLYHVKKYNGFMSIHWKRTGIRKNNAIRPNMLDGIIEALEYGLRTGIKVEISHLAIGFDIYPSNEGLEKCAARETLRVIDEYIEKGADVAFDVIPGTSGGICCQPYLISNFFTPWIKMSGTIENFIANLRINEYRENLVSTIYEGKWFNINPKINPEWDKKIIITKSSNDKYVNRTIYDIAKKDGVDSVERVMSLLIEDPEIMINKEPRFASSALELLKHSRASVCTDTYSFDIKGIYGLESECPELLPHTHTYCAFPKYILEFGMNNIEDTIRKITGFPAEFIGIKNRGLIKENYFADILIIDYKNLRTKENYIEPRNFPEGINYVFVNGQIAVDNSQYTGNRAGRVLRK